MAATSDARLWTCYYRRSPNWVWGIQSPLQLVLLPAQARSSLSGSCLPGLWGPCGATESRLELEKQLIQVRPHYDKDLGYIWACCDLVTCCHSAIVV